MKLLRFNITPLSTFLSLPKGDMIFGHFAYHLFDIDDNSLENYLKSSPSVIFSDFLPKGYLPKPSLPLEKFGISIDDKKDFKKSNLYLSLIFKMGISKSVRI